MKNILFIILFLSSSVFALSPQIEFSDSSIDFGSIEIGEEESLSLEIRNISNSNLEINNIWFFGDREFDYYESCEGILMPGEDCSIEILFIPTSYDDFYAELSIEYNDEFEENIDVIGEGE
ncbi:MAG: choice-of-anchor D domain-containing protein [Bdellovibrionales bacterium]|jgi:hypothetical protein|nr:choice-of-anchor D domain-containing protein [Bdellovibrionales bacterium]